MATSRTMIVLLTFLLCSSLLWAETSGFKSLLFDGSSFRESRGEGAILVRDGMLPAGAEGDSAREDQLPAGTGAVALYCYRQSSGGKLRSGSGVSPLPGVAVSVRGTAFTLAARTNSLGYLILALPAGSYELRLFGFTKRVVLEPGKTTLAFIRGGKRMVD
jgi:hypothetical protein